MKTWAGPTVSRYDPPSMLFVRTYKRIQGGHFKVVDYIEHVRRSGLFRPVLYLAPTPTAHEFDRLVPNSVERVHEPFAADAFFVAGNDWETLDEAGISTEGKPIVNLIQGFAHSRPASSKRRHLERRALRVCVSEAVRDSLIQISTPQWPVAVVANGIDWRPIQEAACLSRSASPIEEDRIFVLGVKDPDLAHAISDQLAAQGVNVDLLAERVPREELLQRMATCTVAVLLPKEREGFYLPALEAMVLGRALVLPDCVGARGFCIDGETCLMPPRTAKELSEAAIALASNPSLRSKITDAANNVIPRYTLERERMEFTQVLKDYVSGKLGAV